MPATRSVAPASCTARALAGRLECGHLRVRPARPLVPSLPHDLAVTDDDGADERVRMRRPAAALRELERPLEGHAAPSKGKLGPARQRSGATSSISVAAPTSNSTGSSGSAAARTASATSPGWPTVACGTGSGNSPS